MLFELLPFIPYGKKSFTLHQLLENHNQAGSTPFFRELQQTTDRSMAWKKKKIKPQQEEEKSSQLVDAAPQTGPEVTEKGQSLEDKDGCRKELRHTWMDQLNQNMAGRSEPEKTNVSEPNNELTKETKSRAVSPSEHDKDRPKYLQIEFKEAMDNLKTKVT